MRISVSGPFTLWLLMQDEKRASRPVFATYFLSRRQFPYRFPVTLNTVPGATPIPSRSAFSWSSHDGIDADVHPATEIPDGRDTVAAPMGPLLDQASDSSGDLFIEQIFPAVASRLRLHRDSILP